MELLTRHVGGLDTGNAATGSVLYNVAKGDDVGDIGAVRFDV